MRFISVIAALAMTYFVLPADMGHAEERTASIPSAQSPTVMTSLLNFALDRVVLFANSKSLDVSAAAYELQNTTKKARAAQNPSLSQKVVLRLTERYLRLFPNRTGAAFCGGFLLDESTILTANHCRGGFDLNDPNLVALRYDRSTNSWQYAKILRQIFPGDTPSINHPLLVRDADIGVVSIESGKFGSVQPIGYSDRLMKENRTVGASGCFYFNWYNMPALDEDEMQSTDFMRGFTSIDVRDTKIIDRLYTSLSTLGKQHRKVVFSQKKAHVNSGDSGSPVFCYNSDDSIALGGVLSFATPLDSNLVGIVVPTPTVQNEIGEYQQIISQ